MKTKQEIKDDYACTRGFRNWEDLKAHTLDLDNDIDQLMEQYKSGIDEWGWRNFSVSRDNYYETQNNYDDGCFKYFKEW